METGLLEGEPASVSIFGSITNSNSNNNNSIHRTDQVAGTKDTALFLCAHSCHILRLRPDAVFITNYLLTRHFHRLSQSETSHGEKAPSCDDSTIAMAALFLCGKLIEDSRKLRDVIIAYKYAKETTSFNRAHFKHKDAGGKSTLTNSTAAAMNIGIEDDVGADVRNSDTRDRYKGIDKDIGDDKSDLAIYSYVFDESYVRLKEDIIKAENYILRLVGFLGSSNKNSVSGESLAALATRVPHKYFLNIARIFCLGDAEVHLGLIIIEDACTCSKILLSFQSHEIAIVAWFLAYNITSSRSKMDISLDTWCTNSKSSASSNNASESTSSHWDTHIKRMSLATLQNSLNSSYGSNSSCSSNNNTTTSSNNNGDKYNPQHSLLWHLCERMGTSYSSIIQCSDLLTDHMLFLKNSIRS